MSKNIFLEIQERKQALISLAEKANEFGWIDSNRKNQILDKIKNDTLTIGVIGQVKCGKSTFINSFIFGDTVLPAATTPMTAALTVITYGNSDKVVAQFYNRNEWEEIKLTASRPIENIVGNSIEESRIEAAKEMLEKSRKIGPQLESLLGTTQEDSLHKLIDYVGANGLLVPIIKYVTIYSTHEYLKGVEIVDTPGFNDPIVSREELTKDFLKKADVVLLMLYAERSFDSTDREILFKNVRECGIGKVIVGINKYDITYGNGHSIDQIKKYVKDEIEKASNESGDDIMKNLLDSIDPIPLSAEMALLSQLPMSRISNDESLKFAWNRSCSNFEINSQEQMREKSRFEELTSAVKKLIETEKEEILFKKSLNIIDVASNNKMVEADKIIIDLKGLINNLSTPDDELIKKKSNLEKAQKKINSKINSFEGELKRVLKKIIKDGAVGLEEVVYDACNKMRKEVDNRKKWSTRKDIDFNLAEIENDLLTRTIKNKIREINSDIENKLERSIDDFFNEIQDVTDRHIPYIESYDFINGIKRKIDLDIDNNLFTLKAEDDPKGLLYYIGEFIDGFIDGFTFGAKDYISDRISYKEDQRLLKDKITAIQNTFAPTPYLESINIKGDKIIVDVKRYLMDELIDPMKTQLDEVLSDKTNNEEQLKTANEKLKEAQQNQDVITSQMQEYNMMRSVM